MLSILPLNYSIYCPYSSKKCINFSLKCERGNMHYCHEHPISPPSYHTLSYRTRARHETFLRYSYHTECCRLRNWSPFELFGLLFRNIVIIAYGYLSPFIYQHISTVIHTPHDTKDVTNTSNNIESVANYYKQAFIIT